MNPMLPSRARLLRALAIGLGLAPAAARAEALPTGYASGGEPGGDPPPAGGLYVIGVATARGAGVRGRRWGQ